MRIEQSLNAILHGLLRAKYIRGNGKFNELEAVSMQVEVARINIRLATDIKVFPYKSQEYAVKELAEIGRMLGGWLKQQHSTAN